MFFEVTDLSGASVLVNAAQFLRARSTYGEFEPVGASMLQMEKKRIFASDPLSSIIARLSAVVPVVVLHVPIGGEVVMDRARIVDVREASAAVHHPDARAVVSLLRISGADLEQQVRESVVEVRAVLGAS